MQRWLNIFILFMLAKGFVYPGVVPLRAACPAHSDTYDSRQITVSVTVPDPAWQIAITDVSIVDHELWVISTLQRAARLAPQIVTTVTDTVTVMAPAYPIKHFVLGKTWSWDNDEPYTFLADRQTIEAQLQSAKRLLTP